MGVRGRTGRRGRDCVVGMASVPNNIKRAFLGRDEIDRWYAEKTQQDQLHTYHY